MTKRLVKQLLFCAFATAALIAVFLWWSEQRLSRAFQAGLVAVENKNLEGITAALDELQGHSQFESHCHLLRGMSHWQKGEVQQALSELGSAIGHPDTTSRALVCSGRIFMEGGDHTNAVRMLTGALEADPQFVEAHRYLVATYYDVGAMEHVLQHIDKVIELAPADMRPWRMRGLILKDFERFDEAVPAYEGALQRSPAPHVEREIRSELAESLLQLRKFDEAIDQLNRLESSADQQAMLAEALLAFGKNEQAERSLERALELEPQNRRAMQLKASVLLEQGDVQSAADMLQVAVARHPLEVDLRSSLMLAFQRLGQTESANAQQVEMNRIRELQDKFHKLHIRSIQDAGDINCRIELARTALQLNKPEAATSWYRAALSMDPTNTTALQELEHLDGLLSRSAPAIRN